MLKLSFILSFLILQPVSVFAWPINCPDGTHCSCCIYPDKHGCGAGGAGPAQIRVQQAQQRNKSLGLTEVHSSGKIVKSAVIAPVKAAVKSN